MYYHGSPTGMLKVLKPNRSMHGKRYVYMCSSQAHATLYAAKCHMYPYGFNGRTGRLILSEPFEGYLKGTYTGKSGYVYRVEEAKSILPLKGIPNAYVSAQKVEVLSVETIEDIHERLVAYESNGLIEIRSYESMPQARLDFYRNWAEKVLTKDEFFSGTDEYSMYLKEKFPEAWREVRRKRGKDIRERD